MNKRIFLAGVFGGVGMFIWASIAHMALPLGTMGVSEIPGEQPVLAAMQAALGTHSGFYLYPALGTTDPGEYQKKLAVQSSGLLIYHPPGNPGMTPSMLLVEFLVEVLESILAVWLLSKTMLQSYGARAGFVAVAGILAALPTNVSYWNWYGFPTSYTAVYMGTQIAGFVVAGLIAAAILRPVKLPAFAPATPALR